MRRRKRRNRLEKGEKVVKGGGGRVEKSKKGGKQRRGKWEKQKGKICKTFFQFSALLKPSWLTKIREFFWGGGGGDNIF